MNTVISKWKAMDSVLINATASVETEVLNLKHITGLEAFVLAGIPSSGNADLSLEYSLSPDGTNFDSYSDHSAIIASTATDYANNKNGYNFIAIPTTMLYAPYIKFRVTGVGSNPATTRATLILIIREGLR